MIKDLVCGRQVNKAQAAEKSEYQGRLYFFCALNCKQQFD